MGFKATDPCYRSALDHERMFVLLARDECAPEAIRAWVSERLRRRKNKIDDSEIVEALDCALRMEQEREHIRKDLGKK